jgi:hypothetical protein
MITIYEIKIELKEQEQEWRCLERKERMVEQDLEHRERDSRMERERLQKEKDRDDERRERAKVCSANLEK